MAEHGEDDFEDELRDFIDAALVRPEFPPNLFLNIIAGEGLIFQYDMGGPFDSDEDDDEYFDEDDVFNEDFEEDKSRKIFVTLQDSHIIKRLSFHRNGGHFRYPHYLPESRECYEDLYRLLEELELLVRVWRRRLEHPYTAHLRSEAKPSHNPVNGENLVEGEDYNQSDYEYDGNDDDEPYDYKAQSSPNKALTKKKFCHSVKIFQFIFKNDKKI